MSEWDKLWKSFEYIDENDQPTGRFDLSRIFDGRQRPRPAQVKLLEKVKAVGDKLKMKAELWDDFIIAYKDRWVGKGLNEDQAHQQAREIVTSWVEETKRLEQENKHLKQDLEMYKDLLSKEIIGHSESYSMSRTIINTKNSELTKHELQVKHNNLKQMLVIGSKLVGNIFPETLTYIQINREIKTIEDLLNNGSEEKKE